MGRSAYPAWSLPTTAHDPASADVAELLFEMRAAPVDLAERRNWNLFLCVDVSGSMAGASLAEAKADAVKFQTFRAETLVSADAPKADYQKEATGTAESQFTMLKRLELDEAAHRVLAAEDLLECIAHLPHRGALADGLDAEGEQVAPGAGGAARRPRRPPATTPRPSGSPPTITAFLFRDGFSNSSTETKKASMSTWRICGIGSSRDWAIE